MSYWGLPKKYLEYKRFIPILKIWWRKEAILLIFEKSAGEYSPKWTDPGWSQRNCRKKTALKRSSKLWLPNRSRNHPWWYLRDVPVFQKLYLNEKGVDKPRFWGGRIQNVLEPDQKGLLRILSRLLSNRIPEEEAWERKPPNFPPSGAGLLDLKTQFERSRLSFYTGVTGSGKTENLIRWFQEVLGYWLTGSFAILPEIALTTQIVQPT